MFHISGMLLKEIIYFMSSIQNNSTGKKTFLYSGHDLTLVSLMRILAFEDLLKPKFGSSLIFELHKIENNHILKVRK